MEEQTKENTLDLNKVMEEGRQKFEGELQEAAQESTETEPTTGKETSPPQSTTEGKPVEGAEKTATGKETEKTAQAPTSETEKGKDKRFKTHDDAEEGYRNLQSKSTRLEEENKALKQRLTSQQEAEAIKKSREEEGKKFREFAKGRTKKTLQAIDELEPEEDDYQDKVADIWADHNTELRQFDLEHRQEASSPASPRQEPAADDGWAYVTGKAKEAEVDPNDDYFLTVCQRAPKTTEDGKPIPLDDQIGWAIKEYKTYHSAHLKAYQEALEEKAKIKGREHQEQELSLDRSGATGGHDGKLKPKIVTLSDAVERTMDERRL